MNRHMRLLAAAAVVLCSCAPPIVQSSRYGFRVVGVPSARPEAVDLVVDIVSSEVSRLTGMDAVSIRRRMVADASSWTISPRYSSIACSQSADGWCSGMHSPADRSIVYVTERECRGLLVLTHEMLHHADWVASGVNHGHSLVGWFGPNPSTIESRAKAAVWAALC